MSVAFVVPAFDAQATIATTISSLLIQRSTDWSAVVVDDGSTDRTREIAQGSGDTRVTVISQENKGLSAARNAGTRYVIERGTANLVCFLDADDCVAPSYVERMTDAIGDADLAPSAFRMVGERLEDVGWTVVPGNHDFALDRLVHVNPVAVSSVLVRLSSMERLGVLAGGLFDESLQSAEDWDLWLRATAAGAQWARVVEEPQFAYRMRQGSMSDALHTMHEASERVIRRCASGQREQALRGLHLRTAARAAAIGDSDLAREHLAVLGPLSERDAGVLVGALRYAFMFAQCTGPAFAQQHWPQWRATIEDVFGEMEALGAVLARLSFDANEIPRAARALVEQLRADQVPVLYGVGRNGRALADALDRLHTGLHPAWVDDHAGASGEHLDQLGDRLTRNDLGAAHFVVVTPDENSDILRSLAHTGARIETIASLALGQPA
jgi:Glycosyl transferase family 2